MKMYHATTPENWESIKLEGMLWGIRNAPSRCTYLATELKYVIDGKYGNIILEVDFDPTIDIPNNYQVDAWQCRCYAPIPISRINRIEYTINDL